MSDKIILETKDHHVRINVTKDKEGFHFHDPDDNAEIWISNENIKELIDFLKGR